MHEFKLLHSISFHGHHCKYTAINSSTNCGVLAVSVHCSVLFTYGDSTFALAYDVMYSH
jgi:hypothetical protein